MSFQTVPDILYQYVSVKFTMLIWGDFVNLSKIFASVDLLQLICQCKYDDLGVLDSLAEFVAPQYHPNFNSNLK